MSQRHHKDLVPCPPCLTYRTADEVAECVSYQDVGNALYRKLWRFADEAQNPTPLGGDGSNGTVETPEERLDSRNDDKAPHWWGKLTPDEQEAILDGLREDGRL